MTAAAALPRSSRLPPASMPYLCARVWARLPRLLPAGDADRLRSLPGLAELFHALSTGDDATYLQAAVLDVNDVAEWDRGLRAAYIARVTQVRRWIDESVPRYAYLVLGEWEMHHLRALVRWVVGKADAAAARSAYVPLGAFSQSRYDEALNCQSLDDLFRRVEDYLPEPAAQLRAFLKSSAEGPPDVRKIEIFLDRLHFRAIDACARQAYDRVDASILEQVVALAADLVNLRTALRVLGRHLPADEIHELYVPEGTLDERHFTALMKSEAIDQLHRQLVGGPLAAAIERGMLSFVSQGRASVFERCFDEQQLRQLRRLARRNSVSVAVPLYYLARAKNELANLRTVVRGIHYRWPAGRTQENLVDG